MGSKKNSEQGTSPKTAAANQATNNDATIKNNINNKGKTEEKISLSEQLDRALAAVDQSHQTALRLHQEWRTHLLRMSYIVMMVTIHQAQLPTTTCIKEIKHWNEIKKNSMEPTITGFQAFVSVLYDSIVEFLGILCGASLLWCLYLPMRHRDFETLPYRLSCAFIPMIVSLYFNNNYSFTPSLSCIKDDMIQYTVDEALSSGGETSKHRFPVVLIFHTIVSLSLWFMQFQHKQHSKNVQMVLGLKKELNDAQKGKKKD